MGLEMVEITMDLEETFGIDIPEEDMERFVTVGDLYHYVLGRMHEVRSKKKSEKCGNPDKCPSSYLFYRLRRSFMRVWGLDKKKVTPNQSLENIVPRNNRIVRWRDLAKESGFDLPPLRRPRWVWAAVVLLAFTVPIIPLLPLDSLEGLPLLYCFLFPAIMILGGAVTRPFAVEFPPGCLTVRDLVQATLGRNVGKVFSETGGDIWPVVKGIVVEVLGVDPKYVTPEARLVADLGVG